MGTGVEGSEVVGAAVAGVGEGVSASPETTQRIEESSGVEDKQMHMLV